MRIRNIPDLGDHANPLQLAKFGAVALCFDHHSVRPVSFHLGDTWLVVPRIS